MVDAHGMVVGGMCPSYLTTWFIGNLMFFTQVIAATGSDEKCKLAVQRGAQFSVNYSQGSLRDAVKKLAGSGGVNVAIDMVGGDVFLESLRRCGYCSVQNG
jgi:NADPH:quinone reductase-like Zn-dependent oxidoreductase